MKHKYYPRLRRQMRCAKRRRRHFSHLPSLSTHACARTRSSQNRTTSAVVLAHIAKRFYTALRKADIPLCGAVRRAPHSSCCDRVSLPFVVIKAIASCSRAAIFTESLQAYPSPPITYRHSLSSPRFTTGIAYRLSRARVRLFLPCFSKTHSMHELLLYGQVSAARHDQVMKILAGVAAMQPRRTLQRRIIYRPEREPEEPGSHLRRGGTQAVSTKQKQQTTTPTSLYYTHLVQKVSEDDFGKAQTEVNGALSADVDFESGEEPTWSTLFEDTPDTGDRGVYIRFTNSTDLIGGNPHTYMVSSGPNRYIYPLAYCDLV